MTGREGAGTTARHLKPAALKLGSRQTRLAAPQLRRRSLVLV